MRMLVACVLAIGCGSPPPAGPAAPAPPVSPATPVATPAAPIDAPPPDAGVPDEVTTAPAWIFRFAAADRRETWTLRYHGDVALMIVERAGSTTRYLGTATDGASLALVLAAGNARLALDCKREKRAIGNKCNDAKAKKLDVLACYHPDFKEAMPFAASPGVEYVAGDGCTGYRKIAE